VYFSLKDNDGVLRSVCWKGVFNSLNVKIEEGLEVVCSGKISTYAGSSMYQLIVSKIEIAGEGALLALLEKRKKELEAEGLFDQARKKPIPFLPLTIGVVTSPTGAVIQDILHRISERFPIHVLVWPTLVQGEGAADQVAKAITGFNTIDQSIAPKPDLIIVARGGGSVEDLWAFNEEVVLRAVARSHIPLISAVGHETDTTLIDYVSDLRAPTPTAAAEKAVPVKKDLEDGISAIANRLKVALPNIILLNQSALVAASKGLSKMDNYISSKALRLEQASASLERRIDTLLRVRSERFYKVSHNLNINLIKKDISVSTNRVENAAKRSVLGIQNLIARVADRLDHKVQLLESYHYKKVLERGFAIVKDVTGDLITRKTTVIGKSSFDVEFFDGVQRVHTSAPAQRAHKQKANVTITQASMFDD
jgi:exodeoxyribonuclease VII large subunit